MRRVPHRSRGSITLVALCLAVVIGLSLASYLALCQQSLLLSTRTTHLARARLLAENGLEEALWSLNSAAHPSTTVSSTAWTNATWTTSGLNKSCTFSGYNLGNGATGTVAVTIANFGGPTADLSIAAPTITATATITVPSLGTFTKTLAATTKPAPLFPNAIGSLSGTLTLPTGTLIDSWDSDYNATAIAPIPKRDYNSSTAPVPYASVTAVAPDLINPLNCAATVAAATTTSVPNLVLNGNATIYGYAMTNGNSLTLGASSLIKGPRTSVNIDQARIGRSAFIPTYQISIPTPPGGIWSYLPANAAWGTDQPIGNTVTPSAIQYWTTNTNESGMTTYNGGGNDLLLDGTKTLTVSGHVILVINEDFELRDSAKIILNPGAQLEIYAHDDVTIANSAGFQNDSGEPKNLALICTGQFSANFDFTYSSSANFTGVIYTADSNEGMTFTSSPVIYGALLGKYTPTFSSLPVTLHYDTALQYLPRRWFLGLATPFLIIQITES